MSSVVWWMGGVVELGEDEVGTVWGRVRGEM